jgi:hypothetical protein
MKTCKTGVNDYRKLLKSFDRTTARIRQVLISVYGKANADNIIRESRREYEAIIPQIPYIGDRNPLRIFLHTTSCYLAFYRILRERGLSIEEAGRMLCRMNEAEIKAIPYPVRRMIGWLWFSPWLIRRFRKRAEESQERRYPDNYVLTFVEGDGRTFDYGIDYTECAGCKFLKQQNAAELAPFMCKFDKVASDLLGWGLTRTMTIANGHEKCDFRFKKHGMTNI